LLETKAISGFIGIQERIILGMEPNHV